MRPEREPRIAAESEAILPSRAGMDNSVADASVAPEHPPLVPRSLPGPLRLLTCTWETPHLFWQMARKEILTRYRGSILGVLWSFATPFVLLVVFTFVFSVIFEARWGERVGNQGEFALVLFAGFIVFWLFSECVGRAPTLILQNVNFVKRIVFPLEILPWVVMVGAAFQAGVATLVLFGFHLVLLGLPPPTAILFPLVLAPLVLMTMGVSWFLASLGVFYRDINHVIGVALTVIMWTSPIIYPVSVVPPPYRLIVQLNPISLIVQQSREVLLWGRLPDWGALGLYLIAGWAVAWLGFAWFMKTKKGFANVV
jgi:lipopolysaccharide transport system permease protein